MKRKLLVVLLFAFTVISFTVIFAACSQDGDKTPPDPGTDPVHTHVMVCQEATDPTCTTDGNKEYWYCTSCEKYFADEDGIKEVTADSITLPHSGHDYTETLVSPTCIEQGYTLYTCKNCEESYKDNFTDTVPHDFEYTTVIEPTCTERGYTLYTCKNCGNTHKDDYTDMTAHTYGEWQQIKNPTCSDIGEKQRFCIDCGNKDTAVIEPLGHSYGNWNIVKAANCTEKGLERRECIRCDIYEERAISALEHDYETKIIAPGCTEQGYTLHICKRCNASYSDTYTEALGHSWGDWETETCTENGLQVRTCPRCNREEEKIISASGHEISDTWFYNDKEHWHECDICKTKSDNSPHSYDGKGVCECGYEVRYTENLAFRLSDDKNYYIVTGIGDATDTYLYIPGEVNGKPIKEIAASALENNPIYLRSVYRTTYRRHWKTTGVRASSVPREDADILCSRRTLSPPE